MQKGLIGIDIRGANVGRIKERPVIIDRDLVYDVDTYERDTQRLLAHFILGMFNKNERRYISFSFA